MRSKPCPESDGPLSLSMCSPIGAAPGLAPRAFVLRNRLCRHRLSFPSENPRSMVFVCSSYGLALGRAHSGTSCRKPSLRLGPSGFHPARPRAPLALLIQPCDHLRLVRADTQTELDPKLTGFHPLRKFKLQKKHGRRSSKQLRHLEIGGAWLSAVAGRFHWQPPGPQKPPMA